MSTFRNQLPLTKTSQVREEESEEQLLPPASPQYHGEASLQVNRGTSTPQQQTLIEGCAKKADSSSWGLILKTKLTVYLISLQATLLGLVALNKAYPEVLTPGSTACVTPTSPWPSSVPWLGLALGRVSPLGAKDTRALLLEALMSPGLRALEARTAVELLDVFVGLEADGKELTEAIAAGNLGTPLPSRATELQEALEQGPRGLALRLWPKLQVVVTLDAGGQAEAVAALRAWWCQGLAFFSPAYAASGGQLDAGLGCRWGWGQRSHS